jgi:assimilatory nitrate reductase catalytic subunit
MPGPVSRTPTHCPYCALQCGMHLDMPRATSGDRRAATVTVQPRTDVPANRGGLCQKGWTAAELLTSRERLTTPLVRDDREAAFREAGWDEALDRVAAALHRIQAEHGRDAAGVFGGGGLTNEKVYALGKFARVALRTSAIDYNGRWCMSSAAAAGVRAFGVDRGLPFPVEDIAGAGAILLAGGNVAETMPPIMRHFTAQRDNGGRLIVVDPRVTATARSATLHLQSLPGTDLALAHGLLHLLVAHGAVDESYVAQRTAGFDDVRNLVAAYWPERVERLTGVAAHRLREAAGILAAARSVMVITARGAEQHAKGVDTVLAFINIALALGQVGKPYGGYGCLTGQGNGQGGREHGQKADQLPGYRRIDDPAAREHVAGIWNVDPGRLPGPGRSAYELLDSLGTEVRGLLVFGSNPVISAPRSRHVARRLESLDFLCVSDIVLSETAARADVVLPITQWAEETGTLTNLEGRVLLRRKALDPPAGVRTDLEVIAGLAQRFGHGEGFPTQPEQVFDELRRASAGGPAEYAGITYDRLDREVGVFWPCPAEDHPGTPRMFTERFPTPDGRARFHAVADRPQAEVPDEQYPHYLTTGRVLAHYQSGAQTRLIRPLRESSPTPFVELHPALAARLGIAEGERVRLTTRRGSAVVPARLTTGIRPDTVFMPFHWGGAGSANALTNPALDPVSRMPEFKVCAVRLEPA